MAFQNSIRLIIPGQMDYVLVVRTALGGVGVLMGLDIGLLDDLRGAAEEACDCLMHQPRKAETLSITCTLENGVVETVLEASWANESQPVPEMDMGMTLGILETLIPSVALSRESGSVDRIVLRLALAQSGGKAHE